MSDSEDEINKYEEIKLVFLGEPSVGKTNIIRKFCYDDFSRQYNQTIGAEFYIQTIIFPRKKQIKLKISDIGGQEFNGKMLGNYLYNTNIVVVVYDITDHNSLDNVTLWMEAVKKTLENLPSIAVVGNKCDLEHKRAVRLDKTKQFIGEYGLVNYLVSAKTGENVNACMTDVIARYLGITVEKAKKEKQQNGNASKIDEKKDKQKENHESNLSSSSSVCSIQ